MDRVEDGVNCWFARDLLFQVLNTVELGWWTPCRVVIRDVPDAVAMRDVCVRRETPRLEVVQVGKCQRHCIYPVRIMWMIAQALFVVGG